jgi:hypothetical protein
MASKNIYWWGILNENDCGAFIHINARLDFQHNP